jgi:hypothetical protein
LYRIKLPAYEKRRDDYESYVCGQFNKSTPFSWQKIIGKITGDIEIRTYFPETLFWRCEAALTLLHESAKTIQRTLETAHIDRENGVSHVNDAVLLGAFKVADNQLARALLAMQAAGLEDAIREGPAFRQLSLL